MRLVIGITGASGVQYGIRLTEVLQGRVETYLITTKTARQIIGIESDIGTIAISAPQRLCAQKA